MPRPAPASAPGPVGRGYSFVPYDRPHARQYRWRLDVQRQFGSSMVLNVGYAGSYTDHMPISHNLAALPAPVSVVRPDPNAAVATNLNTNVPNPYNIKNFTSLQTSNPLLYNYMASNSFFTSTTIRKSALLSPNSQMNGTHLDRPVGQGEDRADGSLLPTPLLPRLQRQRGLHQNVGLCGRLLPQPLRRLARMGTEQHQQTAPHHQFRGCRTALWQRPQMGEHGPAYIVGGFQISVISEYQPGALITWPATTYYSGSSLDDICGTGPHTIGQWFNTANFQTNSTLVATTGQARVFPNIINGYGGCRGEALKRWNLEHAARFQTA